MKLNLRETTIHKYFEPSIFTDIIVQMVFKTTDNVIPFAPERISTFITNVPTIKDGDVNLLVIADIFTMPLTRKGDPVMIGLKLKTICIYDYYPEEVLDQIDISEWTRILKP